jgi:hypothetical protein
VLFILVFTGISGLQLVPASAKMSSDFPAGIVNIHVFAYQENEPLRDYVSPTIDEYKYRDGLPETIANQYTGSNYTVSINTSVDNFDDNQRNSCRSNLSFTFFVDEVPLSESYVLEKEWNNRFAQKATILFAATGTYSVKLSGDFTCKSLSSGKETVYPVLNEFWLAKVVNQAIPSKANISTIKCPAKFKISKFSDLSYKCVVKVNDKDHVIDEVSITPPLLGMTRFLCNPFRTNYNKTWIKTASGWEIPTTIKCPMVTPAMYENMVRVATVNFYADITDQQIRKGEKFTEYESANYTFNARRQQFTFGVNFSK